MNRDPSPPTLRCPACSAMTPLPAVHCVRCGAHLSSGYAPPDYEAENAARRKKRLTAGLALIILLGLTVLFFALSRTAPPPAAARPPAPANDVEAAVETMQSLADRPDGPGVRPDIIINRTKAVTGQAARTRRGPDAEDSQENP